MLLAEDTRDDEETKRELGVARSAASLVTGGGAYSSFLIEFLLASTAVIPTLKAAFDARPNQPAGIIFVRGGVFPRFLDGSRHDADKRNATWSSDR